MKKFILAALAATPLALGLGLPAPAHADEYCGNFTYAGPNTSCDFALNVRDSYRGGPVVTAHSPVTNAWYTMSCQLFHGNVECTGGDGAVVDLR